jgi:hypothetical protein
MGRRKSASKSKSKKSGAGDDVGSPPEDIQLNPEGARAASPVRMTPRSIGRLLTYLLRTPAEIAAGRVGPADLPSLRKQLAGDDDDDGATAEAAEPMETEGHQKEPSASAPQPSAPEASALEWPGSSKELLDTDTSGRHSGKIDVGVCNVNANNCNAYANANVNAMLCRRC